MTTSGNVDGRIRSLQEDLDKKQNDKYTGWMNGVLRQENLRVENLSADLRDGVKLMKLLEILTDEKMVKTKGATKLHWIDNVNRCLNALRRRKIRIEGISAEQVVAGSVKDITALVTIIHQSHQAGKLTENAQSARTGDDEDERHEEGLLNWCKEKTKGYRRVDLKDFAGSWRSGLALNALIHSQRPDLVDYDSLNEHFRRQNLIGAFDVLERVFGVKKIIGVDDVDRDDPNEKAILAYVASIFQTFYKNGNNEGPPRRSPPVTTPKQQPTSPKVQSGGGGYWVNGPQRLTLSSSGPPRHLPLAIRMDSRKRETAVDSGPPKSRAAPSPSSPIRAMLFEGSWECDYCCFSNIPSTRICAMCFKDIAGTNDAEEEAVVLRGTSGTQLEKRMRPKSDRDEPDAGPSASTLALRRLDAAPDGPSWECPGCHHRNPTTTSICGFCFRTVRQLKALSLEEMGVAKPEPAHSLQPATEKDTL